MTIPQAIEHLISRKPGIRRSQVAEALNLTQGSLLKIMREEKDLPFLAAVKLLDYFKISFEEFVGMLSREQLEQQEISRQKHARRMERRRAEGDIITTVRADELEHITGLELMTTVMEVLRGE